MTRREAYARYRAFNLLKGFNISEPPIPVFDIAEKVARVKYFYDEQDLREGYTFYWPRWDVYYICLNLFYPSQMERVCAYSVAHVVLGHYTNPATSKNEQELQQQDADIFVRSLLMPKELVLKYVGFPIGNIPEYRLRELRSLFNVSWDILMTRLQELERDLDNAKIARHPYPGKLYRIK